MSPAAERVMARADALAAISETPDGLTRVYLSTQHLQANQLVGEWMRQAGMTVWQDSVGNICGRYEGAQEGAQAMLLGSHLDTVRNAGRYDGMLGVLTAIEVVDNLHQQGRHLAGTWPQGWLETCDAQGISVAQAMVQAGLDPTRVALAARHQEDFSACLELHIEQGPCLEQEGLALGVVEAINGARRLNCRFTGEAGHAGTVPMNHRKDALAAAAEWMVLIENTTRQQGGNRVATVGELRCLPGAVNVIPGEVALSLDIRGPQDAPLDALLAELLAQAQAIAARRGLSFSAEEFYRIAATPCDARLQRLLGDAVESVQGRSLSLPSGAGHDTIALAERWPVGMLFVRCNGGIIHHPAESVIAEDVALASEAFGQAVRALGAI